MRRFIRNTVLFSILPLSLIALSFFLADGTIDSYYLRFTTAKQADLILGTSRAAQGLQPDVIDSVLNRNGFSSKLFNYAFTLAHSPYGPVYLKAIERKLDETIKNGIYIAAVDPWSVSSRGKDPNDSCAFDENRLCLATTTIFNSNGYPNIDYLINSFSKPIFSIYADKIKNALREPTTVLHKNGWLEVKLSMNATELKARLKKRMDEYNSGFVPYYHFSALRFSYLEKTIDLLSQHGSVYLVRLPIDSNISRMDDRLVPGFDSLMMNLASRKKAAYINYLPQSNQYAYSDGHHLYKGSARELSRKLGEAIVNLKKKSAGQQADKQSDKDFLTKK